MKRSEMIALIVDEIDDKLDDIGFFTEEELANNILMVIEKAGMLPPSTTLEYDKEFKINQWDEE